jgi:predicted nuclease of predicted toxin-antitoxin system
VKLLLDEMFLDGVAVALRDRRHDVVSIVGGRPYLRHRPDPEVFDAAQDEQRAVVTENVPDYLAVVATYQEHERAHWGLILTSNRAFPRHRPAHGVRRLVAALDALLSDTDQNDKPRSEVIWLRPAAQRR